MRETRRERERERELNIEGEHRPEPNVNGEHRARSRKRVGTKVIIFRQDLKLDPRGYVSLFTTAQNHLQIEVPIMIQTIIYTLKHCFSDCRLL